VRAQSSTGARGARDIRDRGNELWHVLKFST
jgi:hypothetical protein